MVHVKRVVVKFSMVMACVSCALGGYCPPQSRQSDGMRDIMLVYAAPSSWKQENFLPYVAYLVRG